ncbi:hypothetical protein BDW75DRAFT_235266 [Aspergillus navahoensis]
MDSTPTQKEFVLCFDGTGNQFHSDSSDSNVLKIFRMPDRNSSNQYHYYQSGIGTYVTSASLSHNGRIQKLKSAYAKAKAAATGSTFADHVMGGYKLLMRYYCPGDQIYFFGFSRGAYIGLLEMGNDELISFTWNTFTSWQRRGSRTKAEKVRKEELKKRMEDFRETFCHLVSQILFLGLFDTVNSVPRFENAWMRRSKFPYTARTSAKVIRHAVSIDEHRAKFRQDLLSGEGPNLPDGTSSVVPAPRSNNGSVAGSSRDGGEVTTEQDIEEVWFPGCHADIGGGWEAKSGECSLSYVSLLWMVHNAQLAGPQFDPSKLADFNCLTVGETAQLEGENNPERAHARGGPVNQERASEGRKSDASVQYALQASSSYGRIRDCLRFGSGPSWASVLSWKLMEYLPFHRMDLQEDGSWKPVRWPLPRGEVRDIPDDAKVHVSAIRQLHTNSGYRPGNLIMGGGGRGTLRAQKKYGTGEWVVAGHEGCPLKETYIRKQKSRSSSANLGNTASNSLV